MSTCFTYVVYINMITLFERFVWYFHVTQLVYKRILQSNAFILAEFSHFRCLIAKLDMQQKMLIRFFASVCDAIYEIIFSCNNLTAAVLIF